MEFEKDLEKKCMGLVKQQHGWLIKLLPFVIAGLPDRLCILPCRPMFFVELKRKGKTASKLQKAIHKQLLKLGQAVYTIDNYEAFKVTLLRHLNLPVYDFRATDKEPL